MEWSVQQIARNAGTTSRTLRHYDDIGLLKPSRTGDNGYRFYNPSSLVRLQRILLLRDLGLGLPAIAEVLDHEPDAEKALGRHLDWLRQEQERLARQIASVRQTMDALKNGGQIMAEHMFDGFDHTRYKDEVEERWGKDAYAHKRRLVARDGPGREGGLEAAFPAAGQRLDCGRRIGCRSGQCGGAGVGPAARRMADRDSRHTRLGARCRWQRRSVGLRHRTR